jgi:glutathione-regulated potassium-efflux system ancillary protein KefG
MENKILVLFAHPAYEKSRVHRRLVESGAKVAGVTMHDLYQRYPYFDIDVEHEQRLLLEHQVIVWQHPLYWYSAPPLLKQWIDLVLEHGWAYGKDGTHLKGKVIFNTISSGGPASAYQKEGLNRYTLREFLRPFQQTAQLCQMRYLPPFVVPGTHRMTDDQIVQHAQQYSNLLKHMSTQPLDQADFEDAEFLNELLADGE